jgi:hypothetical protein
MSRSSPRRPRLLLLSMYPLGAVDSGPTVRITRMRDALARICDLTVIAGYRTPRTVAMTRYLVRGKVQRLDGIYVESSTFLPAPADIAFLGMARALGVPVLTFIRDAYPLFPEYSIASAKARVARRLFVPAFKSLMAVSSRVAFPSTGLAAALGREHDAVILPPGASEPLDVPRRSTANRLLHVGGVRWSALGGDLLLSAIAHARDAGTDVRLTCVCRPGEEPAERPSWMDVVHTSGRGIESLLDGTMATVIARHRTPYNDLAVPIKLMEYLSYGRPLLVTDCTETARIVNRAGAGVVVDDDVVAFSTGIQTIANASDEQLDAWSVAARNAAQRESWEHRARRVVELLTGPR